MTAEPLTDDAITIELEDEGLRASLDAVLDLHDDARERAGLITNPYRMHGLRRDGTRLRCG